MKKRFVFLFSVCILASSLSAKVTLPAIFSDNMVLQQNARVNLWGKASPGEKVTVNVSWTDKVLTTQTASDGAWRLELKTPAAVENQSITVAGENSISINNVLIGEVWLCTGQSNMEFPVSRNADNKWMTGMLTESQELKDADYPALRLFRVEHQLAPTGEVDNCEGRWLVCSPENLHDFSAIGFVFGRRLHKELNVPVGMIQITWGGTHAESWTKMSVMKDNPLYADVLKDFALKQGQGNSNVPATLWNGMVHPVLGYAVKGNIWYQGESNAVRYEKYQQVFTNLINSWRKEWKQPDMPFYFMQIAPFYRQPAGIREAQLKTWQSGLKNIGMAVVTDAADSTDIHPRDKRVAGERFALWALARQYGKNVSYSGPLFETLKVEGEKAILSFKYAEGGLMTPDNAPVKGFFLAGVDQCFYSATAVIKGNRLEVTAPQVKVPVAVRYGFSNFFRVNLYNKAGLPAVPFRSDTWILADAT